MINNRYLLVGALLASVGANAATEPQAFSFEAGTLTPTVRVTQRWDDNIFSQPVNKVSSPVTQVAPVVQFLSQKDSNTYALTYSGEYAEYWDSSADNYDDHTFSFDASMSPADIYAVDFGASFAQLHDDRGTGGSEGGNAGSRAAPDQYDLGNLNLLFDYGRESAMLGVELEGGLTQMEYTNNREATQFRDRNERLFAGRGYFAQSDRTDYYIEYRQRDFRYKTVPLFGSRLDNTESSWSLGMEWEATGKTTGRIKIGETEKAFEAQLRGKPTLVTWDAQLDYAWKSYSMFMFSAVRAPQETNGTGSFIEATDYNATWIHGWSDRFSSTAVIGYGEDKFDGSNREDERVTYTVQFDYDFQRWMNIAARYVYRDRDSTRDQFNFERNMFAVDFNLSL